MKKYLVLILFIFCLFFIYSFENTNIIKYIVETDYHSLKTLLKNGADIEQTDKFGNTPLFISILEPDKIEITKLLIHYGADVNAVDDFGQTPLIKSIYSKNIEAVELLLENGADIEFKDCNGNTPLFISIKHSDKIHFTQLLLENGSNINAVDADNNTPIFKTLHSENIAAFKLLIQFGANTFHKDNYGNTIFDLIIKNNKINFFNEVKNLFIKNPEIESIGLSAYNNIDLIIFNKLIDYNKSLQNYNNSFLLINGGYFDLKLLFVRENFIIVLFLILFLPLFIIKNKKTRLYYFLIIFLLIYLYFYFNFTNNFIKCDEWNLVDFLNKFNPSIISSYISLFNPNSIHIIFTLKIYALILFYTIGYNSIFFMLTGIVLHLMALILILKSNKNHISNLTVITVILFFFSLRQTENFFWGFQLSFIFSYFFTVCSFYFINLYQIINQKKYFFLSILFSFLASLSSFMGILSIVPGFFISIKKRNFTLISINILFNFILLSIYYIFISNDLLSQTNAQISAGNFLKYFSAYLSSGFFYSSFYFIPGIFISLLYIYVILTCKKNFFNNCLMFFSIFTGLFIIAGRNNLGLGSILSSRFSTFSIIGITGLYLSLIKCFGHKKYLIILLSIFLISSSFFYLFQANISLTRMNNYITHVKNHIYEKDFDVSKININRFYFDKDTIIENFDFFKQNLSKEK